MDIQEIQSKIDNGFKGVTRLPITKKYKFDLEDEHIEEAISLDYIYIHDGFYHKRSKDATRIYTAPTNESISQRPNESNKSKITISSQKNASVLETSAIKNLEKIVILETQDTSPNDTETIRTEEAKIARLHTAHNAQVKLTDEITTERDNVLKENIKLREALSVECSKKNELDARVAGLDIKVLEQRTQIAQMCSDVCNYEEFLAAHHKMVDTYKNEVAALVTALSRAERVPDYLAAKNGNCFKYVLICMVCVLLGFCVAHRFKYEVIVSEASIQWDTIAQYTKILYAEWVGSEAQALFEVQLIPTQEHNTDSSPHQIK